MVDDITLDIIMKRFNTLEKRVTDLEEHNERRRLINDKYVKEMLKRHPEWEKE